MGSCLPLNVSNKSMYIYVVDTTQVVAGHNMSWKWRRLWRRTLETSTCGQQITEWRWTLRKPKHRSFAKNEESLKIAFHDQVTETVSSTKLLEIYLDSSLTWDEHAEKTRKKIYKRLGLLKRSKQFLRSPTRVMFYNALVQPVMDYSACVWGDSFIGHSNTMLRLQRRAASIIIIIIIIMVLSAEILLWKNNTRCSNQLCSSLWTFRFWFLNI